MKLFIMYCFPKYALLKTSSVDGLRSQSTSQSQTYTKKGESECLVVCCHLIHYSFLNPSETITSEKYAQQINEMHWKLKCLQLASVNKRGSVLLHDNAWLHVPQPMLPKLNELGYEVLPHLPYSPDLLPTNCHFFKHLNNFLADKMLPQPAGGRKCFPRVCWIQKHGFLCYWNKQMYFLLAKMCWL